MNRTFLTAFSITTFLALCLPQAEAKQLVDADASLSGSYLAGRTAGRARDNDAAIAFIEAALKHDPGNTVLIERLFQLMVLEGRVAEAEKLAEKVIVFNSQQRMARLVLGLKEFRLRRYEEARTHFTEAAYTPVGELTSALLIAWSYAGEGSHQAAMTELNKLDSNESFAHFKSMHSALISDFLANSLRAESSYKKAYQNAGSSLRVTQAYGNYLERQKRFDEAARIYQNFLAGGERNVMVQAALNAVATKTVPEPFVKSASAGAAEALFSLAAAMNDDQSIDVAQLYARLSLSMEADKPVVMTLLGSILESSRQYEESIEAYEQVPSASPLRLNADSEIAVNLQRLGRQDEAQARMRSILQREPDNLEAWSTLGNLYRNSEKYKDGVEAYDKAIALAEKDKREHWSLYYYRAICLERMKQWDKAEVDFRKALSLSPNESSVLNYLGYSLIDMNMKLEEALAMVQKAVELKPNDGYIVDSLGWAYFRLGRFEDAVVHLERAVDLKPGDPTIAEHLGDAYWRVGRKLEAGFQWQHAKDNKPEPADLVRIEGKLKNGMDPLPDPPKPAENGTKSNSNG